MEKMQISLYEVVLSFNMNANAGNENSNSPPETLHDN